MSETAKGPEELELILKQWGIPIHRVPVSKFRREMRKWTRYIERTGMPVIVTQRFGGDVVFMKVSTVQKMVDMASESV